METYTFLKPFRKQMPNTPCGVPLIYEKQQGDIIQGVENGDGTLVTVRYGCPNNNRTNRVGIPRNVLRKQLKGTSNEMASSVDGSDNTTNTESTGNSKMIKNIIIGVVVVGAIYILYKTLGEELKMATK